MFPSISTKAPRGGPGRLPVLPYAILASLSLHVGVLSLAVGPWHESTPQVLPSVLNLSLRSSGIAIEPTASGAMPEETGQVPARAGIAPSVSDAASAVTPRESRPKATQALHADALVESSPVLGAALAAPVVIAIPSGDDRAARQPQPAPLWDITAWLERFKTYPRAARRARLEGTAEIWLLLDDQGKLHDHRLVASSGHRVLDEAALALVRRAAPYPPLERGSIGRIEVVLPVSYRLDPGS